MLDKDVMFVYNEQTYNYVQEEDCDSDNNGIAELSEDPRTMYRLF